MSRLRAALPPLLVFLLCLAAMPAAQALPERSEGARAGASVTVEGRGYGHGKGMSQYGALGRARAGQKYHQIVRFYYPGTAWGSAAGQVTVLITADDTRDLVVNARSGLSIRSLTTGKTWKPKVKGAKRWRIDSASGGRSAVSYLTGRWHRWRTFAGEAQFGGGPLTLITPDGQVRYRGVLRSVTPQEPDNARDRDTVNILPLDSYLQGVVPREVPALWPAHAVRAQAVAARTYAAFERTAAPTGRHYQICDTARCQVYGGLSAEHAASNAAIQATGGRILTADGEPAFTQFSASNGGWTVAGSFAYLPAQADPFDTAYRGWTATIDTDDVGRVWSDIGTLESITVDERDGNGAWRGRALSVRVTGSGAVHTANGSDFASWFGLRSNWFRVTPP